RNGGSHVRRRSDQAGYNAFISYSHALDGQFASALQRALHRFAKPWYRLRAARIFQDKSSLSADPGLWSAIERALSSCEFMLLLASPAAAQSAWVDRETTWWLTHRSATSLLIVVTAGDVAWHRDDFDWGRTSALPRGLQGRLAEEPRWVDARWARDAVH